MNVVVIGAGLTGLSAAWHLARRGVAATVVEAADRPGGACRTLTADGFHFDLTGHLLHLARPESREVLAALGLGRAFRVHRRRAGIALAGTITPPPPPTHTPQLPPAVRRDCLLGFVEAAMAATAEDEPAVPESFAAWASRRFGEGFARHFFVPYNGKLFCTPADQLTTEWVGRYVPRPRLADVIDGALGLFPAARAVGYNASFLYPREGGISLLPEALAAGVAGVRLGCPVRRVTLGERTVELDDGEVVGWDSLVSTMALSRLAAITADLPPEAAAAAGRLRAVAVVNVNLGVRGRAPRREHWLYVPEARYPFYRVGFPSNHGRVAPAGCHTVSVEVSVPAGTPTPAGLAERCIEGLGELGLLRDRRDIVTLVEARIDPAYVVFDATRPAAAATLRGAFGSAGVVTAGRWAEWKYSTMEDALWDGAAVARGLVP